MAVKHTEEWSTLKTKVKKHWSKLTEADLKKIIPIDQQVAALLEKKYKYTKKEALDEAKEFFSSASTSHSPNEYHSQIHDLKNTICEMTEGFVDKIYDAKDKVERIPELAQEGEEKLVESIKEHPLSSLGIVAAAGFILGSIITK